MTRSSCSLRSEDCSLVLTNGLEKYDGSKTMVNDLAGLHQEIYICCIISVLYIISYCTYVLEPVVKVPINLSGTKMYVIYSFILNYCVIHSYIFQYLNHDDKYVKLYYIYYNYLQCVS